jgi:glycosyltransferase involved in cell wall biosynthesis
MFISYKMDSKLIIAGCCRNVEKSIPFVMNNIKDIAGLFTDYHCIFIESDSSDNTLSELRKYESPSIGGNLTGYPVESQMKCEVISLGHLSNTIGSRTLRLSICRNTIIQRVKEIKDAKYLLMMDMDDVGSSLIDMEGVKSNFKDLDWSVMTASNPRSYYDIWALRWPGVIDYDCITAWHTTGDYDTHVRQKTILASKPITDPPVLVKSAFNGAGFYKIDDIKDCCKYVGFFENREICEHVPFHECIRSHGGTVYINPRFVINYC